VKISGKIVHAKEFWAVPPESTWAAAFLVLDHGTIVLRKGEMIGEPGEDYLASFFSGLGNVLCGRRLDFGSLGDGVARSAAVRRGTLCFP
jgi:hypothetical protein